MKNTEKARALIDGVRPRNDAHCAIRIVGEITDALANRVVRELAASPRANTLTLTINSEGGDLRAGRRIYDAVNKHPAARKLAFGYGDVASAAALVFVAADVRRLHPNARVLLHNVSLEPSNSGRWTKTAYASHVATLEALDASVARTIAKRCGVPVRLILARMEDEKPTPLVECQAIGFCHEIVGVTAPLHKGWPRLAKQALAAGDSTIFGAGAYRFSEQYITACAIGGME